MHLTDKQWQVLDAIKRINLEDLRDVGEIHEVFSLEVAQALEFHCDKDISQHHIAPVMGQLEKKGLLTKHPVLDNNGKINTSITWSLWKLTPLAQDLLGINGNMVLDN